MNTSFAFTGSGGTWWPIWLRNALLRIVTLNFYYPWAKAKRLRYQYAHTEFAGSPFEFHGTGRQLFRGYITVLLTLAVLGGLAYYISASISEQYDQQPTRYFANILVILLAPLYPLAVHGTVRYRMGNTTWRGIRLGYLGTLSGLYKQYLIGLVITILTFGIGASWLQARLRRYVIGHAQVGQVPAAFHGSGGSLFGIIFLGYFATIFTLGIYIPWFIRNLLRYQFNNISFEAGGQSYYMKTDITAGQCFLAFMVLPLLGAITLGLASPWTWTAQQRIFIGSLSIEEGFPVDALVQINPEYKSAFGEDLASVLDVDFGL